MMTGKKRLLFDSVIVTGANIFDNIVFFAVSIMAARYLSVDNYGEYTTAIGYATFFIAFCDIGLNQTFIKSISLNSEKMPMIAGAMIILKGLLTVITYGILCGGLYLAGYSHSMVFLSALFGVIRLCSDYLKTFFDFYDAKRKFIISTILKSLFSVSLLAVTIGAVKFDKGYSSLFTFRLAAAAGMTFFVAAIIMFSAKKAPSFNIPFTISFFKQSIPFGVSDGLFNAYQRIGIIVLSLMLGTAVSGLYNNALLFFTSLLFLPKSVSRVLLPLLYRLNPLTERDKYQKIINVYGKYLGIAGFYIAFMIFLFGGTVIVKVFGSKYSGSVPMLKIIALAIPFIFSISDTVLISLNRQKDKMLIELAVFIILIVSTVCMIHYFGSTGAVISVVITYLLLFLSYRLYLFFKLGFSIISDIIITGKLLFISFTGAVIFPPVIARTGFFSGVCLSSAAYAVVVFLFVFSSKDVIKKISFFLFGKIFSEREILKS